MSYNAVPIYDIGAQFFSNQGVPLAGGAITSYLAGSSTLAPTYTDNTGGAKNSNPIVLDVNGRLPAGIYIPSGSAYKFILKDSNGDSIGLPMDDVAGINDVTTAGSQWVAVGAAPSYISGTSFSVPGNLVSTFPTGIAVQSTNTAGTVYSHVTAASYGSGITTVTVSNTSGNLDSGLSAVNVGLITPNGAPYVSISGLTIASSNVTGTSTNDNAPGGNLGEVISAQGNALAVSSGTPVNGTSINLTAGDWDVYGASSLVLSSGSTQVSQAWGGVSQTSVTLPAPINSGAGAFFEVGTYTLGVPPLRISLAAPATVYLVNQATFTGPAPTMQGSIYARRAR